MFLHCPVFEHMNLLVMIGTEYIDEIICRIWLATCIRADQLVEKPWQPASLPMLLGGWQSFSYQYEKVSLLLYQSEPFSLLVYEEHSLSAC